MWQFGVEIAASALCQSCLCLLVPSAFGAGLRVCVRVCLGVHFCMCFCVWIRTPLLLCREPVWVEFSNLRHGPNETQLRLCCCHRSSHSFYSPVCYYDWLSFAFRKEWAERDEQRFSNLVVTWSCIGSFFLFLKETSLGCSFFYLIIQMQRPTGPWRVCRGVGKKTKQFLRSRHAASTALIFYCWYINKVLTMFPMNEHEADALLKPAHYMFL